MKWYKIHGSEPLGVQQEDNWNFKSISHFLTWVFASHEIQTNQKHCTIVRFPRSLTVPSIFCLPNLDVEVDHSFLEGSTLNSSSTLVEGPWTLLCLQWGLLTHTLFYTTGETSQRPCGGVTSGRWVGWKMGSSTWKTTSSCRRTGPGWHRWPFTISEIVVVRLSYRFLRGSSCLSKIQGPETMASM